MYDLCEQGHVGQGSGVALEDQRAVGATKTKIVLHGHVNAGIARCVGAIIQIALGIWLVQIDGWGDFLMVQGQDGEHAFYAARSAQQVAGHGFEIGRAHV